MKNIIKFIKEFLVLREEDKIHTIPWEMVKSIFSTPTAWKYKGKILIPHDESRWSWKRTVGWYPWVKDKAPSGVRARDSKGRYMGDDDSTDEINEAYEDGKSPVNHN